MVRAYRQKNQDDSYEKWEHIVLGSGYKSDYCDDIKWVYVAEEQDDFLTTFQ